MLTIGSGVLAKDNTPHHRHEAKTIEMVNLLSLSCRTYSLLAHGGSQHQGNDRVTEP